MKSYEHSFAFSNLKDITEKIETNLTSLEYLQTLDMFLWNAVAPIQAECPALFHEYMSKVVARQIRKPATKFTSLTKDERLLLPAHLFNLVTTVDQKKAHEIARSMHLNRGLISGFILQFQRKVAGYEILHSPFQDMDLDERRAKIEAIERAVQMRPGGTLYSAIHQVEYWFEKARTWKAMIVEKFTRMALNHARSTYKDFNHFVPLNEVVQIYLWVVIRAIDRCDARQGVLTSFITNWFKSGRSEVGDLAKYQTDQSYEQMVEDAGDSISDVLGFAVPDESQENIDHIAFLAKSVDRFGYVRAPLHIPEFVSREAKLLLLEFALEE
jgi:hypothetical protein